MVKPAKTNAILLTLQAEFTKERSPVFAYGLAATLALAFLAHLFPLSFFAGDSAFFEQIDASQHVAGWLFYARDSWHFPLLHTVRLNYPEGASIAFTDSIPLAALPFKLFARWLPASFHYIGLWHALAFAAQAVAATFLIRAFGLRHALATACAVFFALTWPALLWRMGHTSLLTHAILLFALGFYFLGRDGTWSSDAASRRFIALNLVGLTVHPYFLAFCYTLFLAFLADQALAGEGWRKQVPRLLSSVVVMAGVGAVLGYFGPGSTTTFGFGYYSMNLSAPFCGGRFIACADDAIRHQFGAYRFADATGGQYEGYNYFGAGALLLCVFVALTGWRALAGLPRRYPALTLSLLLFTLYAVSNRMYFGMHEILAYPLPAVFEKLTGTFRSGGRFFWVVGYALLFAVLAALLKKRSAAGMLLLAVAVPLQWMDVQPLRQRIADKAAAPAGKGLESWTEAMTAVDSIHVYPAFGCGDGDVEVYWLFPRLAAHYGKRIDTGYIARLNVDCERNARAFAGDFAPGALYVMPATYLKNPFIVPAGFRAASERGECVAWQFAALCRRGADRAYWAKTGLPMTPVAPLKPHGEWPADVLPTQIGVLRDGRMVPSAIDKQGFLTYGPYIVLPPGRYHYAIDYASHSAPSQQVGKWDIVTSGANGSREKAAGLLAGTGGASARVEGVFSVDDEKLPLEIRTFFMGGGNLQIIGIALKKYRNE